MVSFGDGSGDPLPFPEVYPALTQPVPDGDQIHAVPEQTYIWDSYSGTAGTATHMHLGITGTGEADEDIAEYDAEIDGSCSFTPPPVPAGNYDLELSFFFRHSGQTAGGTLLEFANERSSRYALTVAASGYQLTVNNGSGSGTYANGAVVAITADPAPSGQVFDRWTGATQYVANVFAASTTVTMPPQGIALTATYLGQPESLFTSVTIWRSFEADGPALFEVDVSAPEGKTITVTVPTEPATVYELPEDEAGEYEYFDNTVANLEAQYPQGDYVLRLYSDAGKTTLEETLVVSFGDGSGDPLPVPEEYPALTQPVPDGGQVHATTEQTYIWDSYSGTAGTATHMHLGITGTGESDEDIAEYDAEIDGSCSFTPPPVAPGDYDLELSFFFRHSGQTAGGTLIECANERYAHYTLTVAASGYQLTVNNGGGSGAYTNGAIVSITADAPVFGRMFAGWTGATQYVANVSHATTSVTMPGAPVTLTATYQLIPVEPAYYDSFEAAQLNPFWVPSLQNGTITPSSDKAYAGAQSAKFSAPGGGQKYLHLRHFFDIPQYGEATVWVYDTKNYLYFSLNLRNSTYVTYGASVGVQDWDYSAYYYNSSMTEWNGGKSSIPRVIGWRCFKVRCFADELVLSVDGQEMYRGSGIEPFDIIELNVSGPGNGTIWFDEFSFVPEIAGRVADPVFEPASGTIFTNELVAALSCATEGASIYYTTDGSEPTEASALYEAPIVLTETTTLKAMAFKASYYPSESAIALFTRAHTLADAVGCPKLLFATGGDAPWFIQSAVVWEGTDAAQSGVIGDRQSSWMETSVEGLGTLSFHWKVSCEDDVLDDWDYVAVTVNGVEVARRDGVTEWELVQLPLEAGMNTVRWVYTKDRVVSEGMDCAWVDGVSWTPAPQETQTTPVPVPHLWLDLHKLVIHGDYETAAFSDTDGDGHLAWEEYVAITDPNDPESVLRVHIHFENGMPVVTWDPDHGTDRSYHLEGRVSLSAGDWEPAAESHRFFRVMVDLP